MKKKRKKGLDLPQFTQPHSTRTVGEGFKKTAPNTFGINKYLPEGEYVAHRTY